MNSGNIELKLKTLCSNYWPILLICILGAITPLIWFKEGLIIAGGDNFFYLNPGANFYKYAYAWLSNIDAGLPNLSVPQIFPFMFFWIVLRDIGVSLINIERLWAILLFVLPGLSMYYLVTHIGDESNKNKLAGFIAAVLYMFNMFVAVDVLQPNLRPVQAALPVMLYFWIKGLNNPNSSLKYPVLLSITSIFYTSSNINLPVVSIIPIVLFLYLIFFITTNLNKWLYALKFTIISSLFYLLINIWWALTTLPSMFQASTAIQQVARASDFTGSTHLYEAFRFMGFWAFSSTAFTKPLIPYAHFYYEPVLLILTYLIPLLTFSILLTKFKNKHILFFAILAVAGLFLVKGVNEPFGFIYKFFYENVPGFWIFREPFTKFTTLNSLAFSVLLGFSIERIYNMVNRWQLSKNRFASFLPKLIPIFTILIILTASYPLIIGKVIQDHIDGPLRSLYVDVPDYWYKVGDWFEENDKETRILLLPKAGYGHAYNWKSGMSTAGTVTQILLPNPIINYPSALLTDSNKLISKVYNLITPESDQDITPFLAFFNVKYILQQNDLDPKQLSFNAYSPREMKGYLVNQPGITFERSFGMLDLYHVNDTYFLPHIYAPKEITYFSGGIDELAFMFSFYDYELKNGIFFSDNLKKEQKALVLNNTNNIFANFAPSNFSVNEVEYTLQVPKTSNYELYINRQNNIDNISLRLDGESLGVRMPDEKKENSYEYKLNHEFTDLMVCDECENRVKASLRFFLPKNILPYDASKGDGVYADGKLIPNLSWKAGEDSIEMEFKTVKKVVSLNVPNDWKFLAETDNADLYETYLPVSFPESYDTSFYNKRSLIVFRDNISLEKEYEKPLSEIDSVVLGQIKPRRMVVSIPKENKTFDEKQATRQLKGNYMIVYAEEETSFPLPEYTIKYRKDSGYVFLGDLNLEKGDHKLKLQFSNLVNSSNSNIVLRANRKENVAQPKITFNKINPTKYKVYVANASEPIFLIFSESYHSGWKAYIGNNQISEEAHLLVNGYANSWYIDKLGDYEITIVYKPQSLLYLGWAVAGVTLVLCSLYLVLSQKNYNKENIKIINDNSKSKIAGMYLKFTLISKVFVALALVLIASIAILMIFKQGSTAQTVAVWAYLSLSIGVLIRFVYFVRINGRDES